MINRFQDIIYIQCDLEESSKGTDVNFSIVRGWIPEFELEKFDPDYHDKHNKPVIQAIDATDLNIDDLMADLNKKTLDLGKIKSIHLKEKTTVPRFKLSKFLVTNDIKISRDESTADAIIVAGNSFGEVFNHGYHAMVSKKEFLKALHKLPFNYFSNLSLLIGTIENHPNPNIVVSNKNDDMCDLFKKYKGMTSSAYDKHFIDFKFSYTELNLETLNTIFSSDGNYYGEECLLKILNVGPVIDKEMYEQLRSMVASKDTQNAVLAMEIMANCNYDKSIVYLCLLFREDYTKIKEISSFTHVNFKSLRSYMKRSGDYYDFLDNIVDTLREKSLLFKSNIDVLLSIWHTESNDGLNSDCFKITQVAYSDQLKEEMIDDTQVANPNVVPVIIDTL